MTWLLPVLVAWAALSVPGLLLLLASGTRLPLRWGWSPVLTILAFVPLSGVLHVLGLPWTPETVVIGTAIVVLGVLSVRWGIAAHRRRGRGWAHRAPDGDLPPRHRTPQERRGHSTRGAAALMTAAGIGAGLAVVAVSSERMGGIGTLNGSYDAFFHLSSIAFIRDSGDAFPFTALEGIYGGPTYYPVAFDALAALLPWDTVTSANALMLSCLAALPSAVGALVAHVVTDARHGPVLAVLAAAASTLFLSTAAMGLVMGLWPIVLGTVCLPPAVAAVLRLLQDTTRLELRGVALVLVTMAGAAMAHPSVMFSAAAVLGVGTLVRGISNLRAGRRRRGIIELVLASLAALAFVVGSAVLLQGMDLTRPAGIWKGALLHRILVDTPRLPVLSAPFWPMLAVWALAGLGAVSAVRRRDPMLITAVAGTVLTVTVGMATDVPSRLATILINPWYGARERIAPLMMCLLMVLMAHGLRVLMTSGERRRRSAATISTAVLCATVVLALLVPGRLALMGSLAYTAYGIQLSAYVTPQEREFIERTAEELPEDAVVLADPRDGATLYWSLGGVQTVYPTMARPQTTDARLIGRYLTLHDEEGLVCGAIDRVGPTHLYRDTSVNAGWLLDPESSAPWTGVHNLPEHYLTLVDQEGPYALYEVESTC